MKQRKFFGMLLSLAVCAAMLLSLLSIGAMAADSVPTSNVYTIDEQSKTVSVKDGIPFVGDFLRQIDSHSSIKYLADENGSLVTYGRVDENMKLVVGNTEYKIELPIIFSLENEIKDIPANTVIFDYSKASFLRQIRLQ